MQINLLPWREQKKKIKKARFMILAIVFAILTFSLLIIFHWHAKNLYNQQIELNEYLHQKINATQEILNDMSAKKDERNKVQNQLQYIATLYVKNFSAVRLLNEIVKITPSTISLDEIERKGNRITLTGIGKSDSAITIYMQTIEKSPHFIQPVLSELNTESQASNTGRSFRIVFSTEE